MNEFILYFAHLIVTLHPRMKEVVVKEVSSAREMKDFVRFPSVLYAQCGQYVPDLEMDIRNTFDPRKNAGLEFSSIQPFIAYRDGKVVGRVAGIVNRHANERWNMRVVRFSMIDFIDDQEVSAALLDAVAQWGAAQGMTHIQGPMGITDFDKEGMLVEDFHLKGSMSAIYNYDYYPRHMEALGYAKEADWLQVRVDIPAEVPPRYARVAQYAREQIGLHVRKLTDSEIRHGYGHKIFTLLNESYKSLFGYTTLTERQMDDFVDQYLSLVDKRLMPVIETQDGEMVGVAITLYSLSDALRKSGGRLWPLGWFHLLNALRWHHSDNAEMLLIAVRPDYQGLGVNAMFFDDLIPIYNECGIKWAETGPQLEDNMRELTQWKPLHPTMVKRRRCYGREI